MAIEPPTEATWQQPVQHGYPQPQPSGLTPGAYYQQQPAVEQQYAQPPAAPWGSVQPNAYPAAPAVQPSYPQNPYQQNPYHAPGYAPPAAQPGSPQNPYHAPGYAPPAAQPGNPYHAPGYEPPPAFYGASPAAPGWGDVAAKPPGLGMVIVITAVFGLFGLIPASRRAKRAEALGLSGSRYWKAFGVTFAVVWILSIIYVVANGGVRTNTPDAETGPSTAITAHWLEQSIVKDGDFKKQDGSTAKPTAATCAAVKATPDGVGTWRCLVDFGKDRATFAVTVGADGRWVTGPS